MAVLTRRPRPATIVWTATGAARQARRRPLTIDRQRARLVFILLGMAIALVLVQFIPVWKLDNAVSWGRNPSRGTLPQLFEAVYSQAQDARLARRNVLVALWHVHRGNMVGLVAILAVGAGVGRWACWWFLEGIWER
jgi:hypothetical protein